MYTAVVADDEQELREALVRSVDWAGAGFSVVGSAENGFEALELVERCKPDLLLTDIRMPFLSGLELAKRVREIRPSLQIAFLSGYDDFEYARQGIQYNIVSYLLKPISAQELGRELSLIREKLDRQFQELGSLREDSGLEALRRRLEITEFLLPLLLSNSEYITDEPSMRARAAELGILPEGGRLHFLVLVSKFAGPDGQNVTTDKHIRFVESVMNKYVSCQSVFVNGRVVSLLTSEREGAGRELELPLRELIQTAERVLGARCSVGVSRETDSLSYCSGAYYEALTARRYIDRGTSEARFITDQEPGGMLEFEYAEKTAVELEQLLKTGSQQELETFLGEKFSEQNEKNLDLLVIHVLATIYKTTASVTDELAARELLSQNAVYRKIVLHDSEENIRRAMTQMCLGIREVIARQRRQNTQLLCDQALDIIGTEYGDPELTLASVSERLHVSPNYLSSRITRGGGEPFSALLTAKRMEVAKNSLLCSSAKIQEIAQLCGYSDQHYFSYCFKRYYGVSPNRMRENVCRGDAEGARP